MVGRIIRSDSGRPRDLPDAASTAITLLTCTTGRMPQIVAAPKGALRYLMAELVVFFILVWARRGRSRGGAPGSCAAGSDRLHDGVRGWRGQAPRQPGQIRKEAAITSPAWVVVQPLTTVVFCASRLRRPGRRRMPPGGSSAPPPRLFLTVSCEKADKPVRLCTLQSRCPDGGFLENVAPFRADTG